MKVEATALLSTNFHSGLLLGLFFNPEDGGDMFLRNVVLTLNGLHGVISRNHRCENLKSYERRNSFIPCNRSRPTHNLGC
jgi:hypothetical protein